MKKLLFGMFVLGLTNLVYPQNAFDGTEIVKLENITVSPINTDYWTEVKEGTVSERVLKLENMAARFDLRRSKFYQGAGPEYRVTFRQPNGKILATYDDQGKMLHSYERFTDIAIPITIRNRVYLMHPGWKMAGNSYVVSYYKNKEAEKRYKVRLEKGNLKKEVKIGS